jgi:hypothetical protein
MPAPKLLSVPGSSKTRTVSPRGLPNVLKECFNVQKPVVIPVGSGATTGFLSPEFFRVDRWMSLSADCLEFKEKMPLSEDPGTAFSTR